MSLLAVACSAAMASIALAATGAAPVVGPLPAPPALGAVRVDSDFDGDGRIDMALWRPGNGVWYVLTSSSNWTSSFSRQRGTSGDQPTATT